LAVQLPSTPSRYIREICFVQCWESRGSIPNLKNPACIQLALCLKSERSRARCSRKQIFPPMNSSSKCILSIPIRRILPSASYHPRLALELRPMYGSRAFPWPQDVGKLSLNQTLWERPISVAILRLVAIIPFHPDMVDRDLHRWQRAWRSSVHCIAFESNYALDGQLFGVGWASAYRLSILTNFSCRKTH